MVVYRSRQNIFVIEYALKTFVHEYMFGRILASGWPIVWTRLSNAFQSLMDWNEHVEKLELIDT
jgi:hypothetical protein